MSQLKFDKNGGFIPQKTKFIVKHDELDQEFIGKYIERKCNFRVDYDNEGNPIFIKKEKNNKEV